jgi:type I restriction enzyme M protein
MSRPTNNSPPAKGEYPEGGRGLLDDIVEFEKQMRRKVHYVIKPDYLLNSISDLASTQNDELPHTITVVTRRITIVDMQT